MPTPRAHGGAPIFPIPLVSPGFYGLNKQEENSILGPEWSTKLNNAVIDDTGRLGARKGFQSLTTSPVAEAIEQTFEYVKSDGTTEQISSTDADIYSGTTVPASIDGALTITDGNWQFQNFVEKCVGFQEGQTPIIYSGVNFAAITVDTDGTIPTGGVGLSAFGRIWVTTSSGHTIRYCDILDETIWDDATAPGDAGAIYMQRIWPKGTDTITAIVAHNGQLIVFGREQIVIFDNSGGAADGVDPSATDFRVVDTISSVGCVSRDSVRAVKGDLWFLSEYGVISLGRLIQEKSAPMAAVSKQIQDHLIRYINTEMSTDGLGTIRAEYSAKDRLYILSFPQQSRSFAFDTTGLTQEGAARVSEWTVAPTAMSYRRDESFVFSLGSITGELGSYAGYLDDGEPYMFEYESGWLEMSEDVATYLKILKRIKSVLQSASAGEVMYKWWWDFDSTFRSHSVTFEGDAIDEWGLMEWNDGNISGGETVLDDEYEWSGGMRLRSFHIPGSGTGQYLKVGVSAEINGATLGLQQLDIVSKIGRYA